MKTLKRPVIARLSVLSLSALSLIGMISAAPAHAEEKTDTASNLPAQTQSAPPTNDGTEETSAGAHLGQGFQTVTDSNTDSQNSSSNSSNSSIKKFSRLAVASRVPGLDASGWQPNIDWNAQKNAGAKFAYLKVSEGTGYTSPAFSNQYAGATSAGLYRGGYHFALPNQSSGSDQATRFISKGGGWSADGKTLPGLLDIEYNPYSSLGNTCYNMSGAQLTSWIQDFAKTYKTKTGRYPAIYSATNWLNYCGVNTSQLSYMPLHIASYNGQNSQTGQPDALPAGWSSTGWSIWQYTDQGPFAGDSNVFNGTASQLQKFVSQGEDSGSASKTTTATGPQVVNGIKSLYDSRGGASTFGTPLFNERTGLVNGGVYQGFSKSKYTIYWSPNSGAHSVKFSGDIGATYAAGGYENTYGYPVSEEVETSWGGSSLSYQWFKKANGQMNLFMWTPQYGTHVITETSGIGSHWANTGRENGAGVPIGPERSIPGGAYQAFMKAGHQTTIVWTGRTGAHSIYEDGAIGKAWSRQGRESGSWGWPTTDEYVGNDGAVHQKFSGGYEAIWTPKSFVVKH